MEQNETKICRLCYKEINFHAKKCPFCHHWQNKFLATIFHPAFGIITGIILLMIFFTLQGFVCESMFDNGEDFAKHKGQISITETQLKFGENKCGNPTVVIIGTMVNNSDISWEDIYLEVQFFDNNKNLTDTIQEEKYSFIVLKNDSSTFKISMPREFSEDQYDSFQIRVLSAKDKRSWF